MKSIVFLCGGYRSVYAGNFIPSLKTIERKINHRYQCVYVFPKKAETREWYHELRRSGHTVETMDFDCHLFKRVRQIKQICRKHNVILIHVNFGDKYAAAVYGWFHRVKIVWHLHTDSSCGKKGVHGVKDLVQAVKSFFGNYIIGCRATKIAVSKELAKRTGAVYIPNGIALERIYRLSDEERQKARREIGLAPDTFAVLLFGWSLDIKGLDLAYTAISHLYARDKKTELLVVCSENDERQKKYLKEKCGYTGSEPFIHLLPPIDDVFLYHNISDIFLSASRSEGFPYSVLEALSIGKPCVISDIEGTAWCKAYENTEFFISQNTEALENAVVKMQERIQNNALDPEKDIQAVTEMYSADKMAQKVVEVYQRIL